MSGNNSESIIVEFPSIYKHLNLVDLICGEISYEMGFDDKTANEISISVIEAATNALEHGNRCCPEESVRVVFNMLKDRLAVEVYDHGEGFDFKGYMRHLPDPADIQKLRGRGIFIMKAMMDALAFEMLPDRGMKVTIEKVLQKGGGRGDCRT